MSMKEARERVRLFNLTAATRNKAKPKNFHEKLDSKLEKLAKKHGVSISLRRNKKKLPVILVGRLKNKPYGEVVKLFNEIGNSSPVPQKMKENGASFRVFGAPKVLSASDEKFIVVGKSKEGTVYWTDHGFLGDKEGLAEVALVDEETADKIKRRNEHRYKDVTDIKIKEHSPSNDNKHMKADENSDPADNYEEDDSNTGTEDSNEEMDDAEIDELVDSLIDFVNTNNIPRAAINKMFDAAVVIYSNDLKNNDPIDDSIGFIVDVLGPQEAETKIKALANMQTLQNGGV